MSKRSPIVHVEWRTRDVGKLQAFYKAVFRWKFNESMPGYVLADTGSKEAAAGFMQIEAGSQVQPGMVSFLEAEDLETIEAAIREAGGQVTMSAQAVPNWGRFSIFTDPDGNQLALWQSEEAAHLSAKKARKLAEKADRTRDRAARDAQKAAAAAEKKARKQEKKQAKKAAKSAGQDKKAEKADKGQKPEKAAKADKVKKPKKPKKPKDKKKDKKNKQGDGEVPR